MLTVRVKLDVRVTSSLDTGIGLLAGRGAGNLCEKSTGGQVNEGFGTAAKGLGTAINVETVGMSRSGDLAAERRGDRDGVGGGRHGQLGNWSSGGVLRIERAGQLAFKRREIPSTEGEVEWPGPKAMLFSSDCGRPRRRGRMTPVRGDTSLK